MRPYAERRDARIARLHERAASKAAEARAAFGAVEVLSERFAGGQPILVGHHSERRARRDQERIQSGMRRGIDASKEAKDLERRADAAEANRAISSDDPDASDKLRAKLAQLEAARAAMVAANKAVRSKDPTAGLAALGLQEGRIRDLLTPDFCGRKGFAPYELTNTGSEIRRIKARIADLEKRATTAPREPEIYGDIRIEEDENRVRVFFPSKPAQNVRDELQSFGFRWAPSEEAWQRHASETAWQLARAIARRVTA